MTLLRILLTALVSSVALHCLLWNIVEEVSPAWLKAIAGSNVVLVFGLLLASLITAIWVIG